MALVGGGVFTLDGENRDAGIDQRRRNIILRRQRVAGAKHRIRATGLEGQGEVGGFGRHVSANAQAKTRQRLLGQESLANLAEHRHFAGGPFDATPAIRRQ